MTIFYDRKELRRAQARWEYPIQADIDEFLSRAIVFGGYLGENRVDRIAAYTWALRNGICNRFGEMTDLGHRMVSVRNLRNQGTAA
jgi:hypothetical protein